jgi:negative regulator of flagellin synthesis FlgM
MDIKTVLGINQSYSQGRIGRGDGSESASSTTRTTTSDTSSSTGADRVTLSDGAKLVGVATKTASEASDVRTDKVADLKAQVEAGTYQPDSKKIAEKMLTMESDLLG